MNRRQFLQMGVALLAGATPPGVISFMDALFEQAVQPPRDYGMLGFWFWNDDLEDAELQRQLRAFADAGLGGVVIHPRVGLSHRVGYLTKTYFDYVRRAVDACAELGLKVVLYDEGSYPSGSACGRVAAENPDWAAHALICVQRDISGPWRGYWRPSAGRSLVNRLVGVVLARRRGEGVDPASLRLLSVEAPGLVRLQVEQGEWRALACLDAPSGGHIRGVFPEQEDDSALAPAAGDLMNPEAVAAFLRLTHDGYVRALGEHLGRTVVAMFTDEPSALGRGGRREGRPYTPGFERWLAEHLGWDEETVLTWLPALWHDYGPETGAFRSAYGRAVHRRIIEVFYRAQAEWCERHGIALTGHPAASNDMASLAPFHWPGQDMVWRVVLPGNDSGLSGPHSVAPKAATSAARARGRRRIVTEALGAYGWGLTLAETKWLLDWHFARGNNCIMPHALFYSVRGGRAFESEPDLGIHNSWWPHFPHLARYAARMSWMLTDVQDACQVAILGEGEALPWNAARVLLQDQIDFLYLDDASLREAGAEVGGLRVGSQHYRVVLMEGEVALSPPARQALAAFQAQGGALLEAAPLETLAARVRAVYNPGVTVSPPAPDLRVMRFRKAGREVWALFNEGEDAVKTELKVKVHGPAEWWDLLRATREPAAGPPFQVRLQRRESRLLVSGPNGGPQPAAQGRQPGRVNRTPLAGPWTVTDLDDNPVPAPAPGDWTTVRELERFSGMLVYRIRVSLPEAPVGAVFHLGQVGEAATVLVNDAEVGWALWEPYQIEATPTAWRVGENAIEVRVTNSAANYYEGALRPSGLLGPVELEWWSQTGA